jgi:hypothetical protein
MDVNGHLNSPAGEIPLILLSKYEAGWTTQVVLTLREVLPIVGNLTTIPRSSNPYPGHFTE